MATIDTVVGGNFQDPGGNALNGTITFILSAPAQTLNDGQAVQDIPISFPVVNGNVPSSLLWGNDQLTPVGTYYIVKLYNANGALVRGPENWAIIGTSPIDLGTIVAYTPTISYPKQIPNEIANVGLTGQAAAIAQTQIVTLGQSNDIRISWNAKITTVATTTSSLGPMTIYYTDMDGTSQSILMANFHMFSGNLVSGGAARNGNSLTTGMVGIPSTLTCQSSTTVSFSFGYNSTGSAMVYELNIIVEQL